MWVCLIFGALSLSCAAVEASVRPADKPGMVVVVEAGDYESRGHKVRVPQTTELHVYGPNEVFVKSEAHVLTNEKPAAYHGGTALARTLGPIDTGTRLLFAIRPESVMVHSESDGGIVYDEGKDYFLDRDWGGVSRVDGGRITEGQRVFVDYGVHLQRVDLVQVSADGRPSIKQGSAAAVCAQTPEPDTDCTALATVYVPYRCRSITEDNICPMPGKNLTWKQFVSVGGQEYLAHTIGLLHAGKPVSIVCWGDSVTQGASASSPEKSYVGLFRTRLKDMYPRSSIEVLNAGIGGSNTDSRRDGYEREVLSYKPDLITVEFVNDVGKPAETIKSNWAEFITKARAANPNVEFILITPHFLTPPWMGSFQVSVDTMREAAAGNKVALADTTRIWESLRGLGIPYETLLANGLNHPNDLGHEFFAESLIQLLRPRR